MRARFFPALALMALTSCADPPTGSVLNGPSAPSQSGAGALTDAVKHVEANSAVYRNEVARNMVVENRSTAAFALRACAIVGVAQYDAAVAAEKDKVRNDHGSVRAAIGTASVVVLSYLYPTKTAALEAQLGKFFGRMAD